MKTKYCNIALHNAPNRLKKETSSIYSGELGQWQAVSHLNNHCIKVFLTDLQI